jgi:hypothetical protein
MGREFVRKGFVDLWVKTADTASHRAEGALTSCHCDGLWP